MLKDYQKAIPRNSGALLLNTTMTKHFKKFKIDDRIMSVELVIHDKQSRSVSSILLTPELFHLLKDLGNTDRLIGGLPASIERVMQHFDGADFHDITPEDLN